MNMTKHAIVTGGMGFIGNAVCKQLVDQNWNITPIDDLRFVDENLLKERHNYIYNKMWYKGLAEDLELLYQSIRNKDTVVIHFASHPNQAAVAADPYGACDNIIGVTSKIAHFCAENNLRMVYISSSMVYGNWLNIKAVEDQPLNPINLYGMYKKQAEEIVRQVLPDQHTIIRPSAVYGPLDNNNRVIMRWINAAINNKPLTVNDPGAVLDFTYVDDLAFGIMKAADKGITDTFNITNSTGYTLYEVAHEIVNMTNSDSEIILGIGLSKDQPRRGLLDINKAKNLLEYSPRVNLNQGLGAVLKWVRS